MYGYGAKIRRARLAEKMTQADLAVAAGFTGHHDVSRIESEINPIGPGEFEALLRALPTLRPVELVEAMGYPLNLPSKDWGLPPALAKICRDLDHDQLRLVLRVARGLLGERPNQPEPGQERS